MGGEEGGAVQNERGAVVKQDEDVPSEDADEDVPRENADLAAGVTLHVAATFQVRVFDLVRVPRCRMKT